MKALNYVVTPNGKLVMTEITEPYIDPLETKRAAVAKTTVTPEFKQLQASIKHYNKFVEKARKDNVRWADPASVPDRTKKELEMKLSGIQAQQDKLQQMEAQEMVDNPHYLVAGNAALIADDLAASIRASRENFDGENIVVVELSAHGGIEALDVRPNILGKLYRMPGTSVWIAIQEPDEFFPDNALFEAPDEGELEKIELARIQALDPDSREAEKQDAITDAKNVLVRETIAAGACDTPEAENVALEAAKEDYKASLKYLDNKYR